MDKPSENGQDIVAIGGSAGGLEALEALLMRLPADLPAAVLVVLHRPAERTSFLPEILARLTRMPVVVAHDGQRLERATCYLGEPDRHLMIGSDQMIYLLPDGFYRAHNVDALFQSLAYHAGSRVIGVVLSGMLKDGSLGLKAINEAGGLAMVQSPDEALFKDMPRNAIEHDGAIDFVGTIDAIAEEICRQVGSVPAAVISRTNETAASAATN